MDQAQFTTSDNGQYELDIQPRKRESNLQNNDFIIWSRYDFIGRYDFLRLHYDFMICTHTLIYIYIYSCVLNLDRESVKRAFEEADDDDDDDDASDYIYIYCSPRLWSYYLYIYTYIYIYIGNWLIQWCSRKQSGWRPLSMSECSVVTNGSSTVHVKW